MKQKLYLDTSVIGGYFDKEFEKETKQLFRLAKQGYFAFQTSVITVDEMAGAPRRVQDLFRDTFLEEDLLPVSSEAGELASHYMAHGVVSERFHSDALHVAVCVIAGIPLLGSWNFKHLANIHRENAFNGVNFLNGFRPVRILTPKSLIYGIEEDI